MIDLQIPLLTTERLVLRGPDDSDYENIATFFEDADRSWGFGGPLNRNGAWRWFASMIGHWALHGYGFWMIETKDGELVGFVGIWYPEGWAEPELGWVMLESGEGKGYAYEAAVQIRRFAYEVLEFDTLCSYILPGNTRSVALAERMGAWHEGDIENVSHGREMVYRHPAAKDLPGVIV